MPLATGTRLGPYEILALIGKGGMGEVYRARDTKLKRDVALKVLPEAFARDPERMARFQREAEVLASLNHPNIAQIYGVEERALVMELVEGESPKGPLSFDDAWKICSQIAAALEYAHDKGVIHRDLKPANVKVTPDGVVKLLDFGLAKAFSNQREPSASPENSPTLTIGATEAGVILGTAAYMAPEQARGKAVDKRADIWAFGVVLYELLTGERMFQGEDAAETLAAVIHKQPDFTRAPGPARNLLRECLEKDPKQRLRDIGDAKRLIGEATPASAPLPASNRSLLPWSVAVAAILVATTLGLVSLRKPAQQPQTVKLFLPPPENANFIADVPAISPDGSRLAFIAATEGRNGLWVRELDSLSARLLPGTGGATYPFWSPDSRSLGFFAAGKLKKIDISGGPAVTLCDAGLDARGGTWSANGVIVFAPNRINSGLMRVSVAGGPATSAVEFDPSAGENGHRFPWFLPDGRHFLYTARNRDVAKSTVYIGDVDSKTRRAVVAANSNAVYVSPGYLLFVRESSLMAQPFDADKGQITGETMPIAENVDHFTVDSRSHFSASQNGILVYASGGATGGNVAQLTWLDRSGKAMGTVGSPVQFNRATISPDGATVAVDRSDPVRGLYDLWLYDLKRGNDLKRGTASRFTFGPGSNYYPVWSPDSSRIAYRSSRDLAGQVFQKAANGVGREESLDKAARDISPDDWSLDGRYILEDVRDNKTKSDIWVLPLFGDRKAFPFLQTEFNERWPKLSPTGQWLAYSSDETGHDEIYVQTFTGAPAGSGGKWQISTSGGDRPIWSRDGKELFYISADGKMMAVEVQTNGGKFEAGGPKPLFEVRIPVPGMWFDVAKDGRFLVPNQNDTVANAPLTVVLNWTSALKK